LLLNLLLLLLLALLVLLELGLRKEDLLRAAVGLGDDAVGLPVGSEVHRGSAAAPSATAASALAGQPRLAGCAGLRGSPAGFGRAALVSLVSLVAFVVAGGLGGRRRSGLCGLHWRLGRVVVVGGVFGILGGAHAPFALAGTAFSCGAGT